MSEVHLGCPPNLSGPQISRVIFSLPPVEPVDRKYMDAFKDEATSTHQVVSLDKDGGSKPTLFVKLYLSPIVVHLGDPRVGYDQSSNFNHGGYTSTSHMSSALMEKTSAPFCCEEFTLSSEFGHDREAESSVESSPAKKSHKKTSKDFSL
ncbi:Protein SABRE [Camellia lanceoleosa]|uniref:Protein SABRE n=1 Tax=Camellia lanceoleosa TaxID=1840588 RepID=A0ACC0FJ69_9ERIC|nr:Protein SABRE [Camellia lanceoleosa]